MGQVSQGVSLEAATADGYEYAFGSVALPGGDYALCWCAHVAPVLCTHEGLFAIAAGILRVAGPEARPGRNLPGGP